MMDLFLSGLHIVIARYQALFKIYSIDDVIGHVATVLSTLALLPQIHRIWKTRSARDISIGMCLLLLMASSVQCVYGVLIRAYPIILTNSISITLRTSVLLCKIYMDAQERRRKPPLA